MKFIRTDAHKKKRLSKSWRKPKGLQNKMRLQKKGYRNSVKVGYRTTDRDTYNGLEIVRVENVNQLESVDPKTQAVVLGSVGRKKKEELISLAEKKKITLVNLSVSRYKETTKKLLEEKKVLKEQRVAKEKEKSAKAEKPEEKAEEKPEEKAEKDLEEKKAAEKKEKDKLLTSKKEQY